MAVQAQTTQAHLWNVLPPDVIQSVLHRLPFRDAWACRSLSCCWASAVRASVAVEVVIPAQRQNLTAKLRRLQQTASSTTRTLPNHQVYTFKLKDPMSVSDCSSLLRSLTKQVRPCLLSWLHKAVVSNMWSDTMYCPQGKMALSCQVLIQLLPSTEAVFMHREKQRLASIVAATSLLAFNNIKVCLGLGPHKIREFPSDEVLNALAPVIQRFDCCSVDDDSVGNGITDRQIRALLPGSHCITSLSLFWSARRHSSLRLLANFVNLQHLELHLDEADGLGHLSSVKGLLELHLTLRDTERADSSCGDILQSNKDSLLHVSLSAGAWDDKTYKAFFGLWKLRTFNLEVHRLKADNVKDVAQLRPSESMSITLHKLAQSVVRRVTSMHNLTSLTLVGAVLTSSDFQPQPLLRELTLRDVHMASSQLQQMVQSYPFLTQLNLHRLYGLLMSPDNLCTILQLRHLNKLCLSRLSGLSAAEVCWLEAFIRSQQSVGMAQPIIYVTCTMAGQTTNICVDYTRYPVWCGTEFDEFDEERATHLQRCWAKVAYCRARAVGLLHSASGRVCGRGIAGSGTWKQIDSKHPLGCLVVVAILGINIACLSSRPQPESANSEHFYVLSLPMLTY